MDMTYEYKVYEYEELVEHIPEIGQYANVAVFPKSYEGILNCLVGKSINGYSFDHVFSMIGGVAYVFKNAAALSLKLNTPRKKE